MKYFELLSDVESQIIRLGELKRLVNVITNGMECSNLEDVESAVNYIQGSIDDIHANLEYMYQDLFDAIVEDCSEDDFGYDEDAEIGDEDEESPIFDDWVDKIPKVNKSLKKNK